MSDGDRSGDDSGLGLAAGFLVAVSLFCLWIGYLDAQTDQYRYQSEEAKKLAVDFCADRVSEQACVSDTLKAFQEQNYGQKDVRAQEHMAIYALGMFVATAFGVAFVARTLHATRQAVRIASKTLKETVRLGNEQIVQARKAVSETRRIGEAQTRAYLIITKVEVWKLSGESPQLRISFVNGGQTPAQQVEVSSKQFIGTFAEIISGGAGLFGPDDRRRLEILKGGFISPPVGPGESGILIIRFAISGSKGKYETNENVLRVAGALLWKDVFGEPNAYRFCFSRRTPLLQTPEEMMIDPWGDNQFVPQEELQQYV